MLHTVWYTVPAWWGPVSKHRPELTWFRTCCANTKCTEVKLRRWDPTELLDAKLVLVSTARCNGTEKVQETLVCPQYCDYQDCAHVHINATKDQSPRPNQ